MKNEHAAALGRLNKGKKKVVSPEVTEARRAWARGLAERRKSTPVKTVNAV